MFYKVSYFISRMQGHASKFPCAWCYGTHPFLGGAKLRTIGELKELCAGFNDPDGNKGEKKKAMDFYNVIQPPLLDGPDETYVLDIIPLGELHVFMGMYFMHS